MFPKLIFGPKKEGKNQFLQAHLYRGSKFGSWKLPGLDWLLRNGQSQRSPAVFRKAYIQTLTHGKSRSGTQTGKMRQRTCARLSLTVICPALGELQRFTHYFKSQKVLPLIVSVLAGRPRNIQAVFIFGLPLPITGTSLG